MTKYELMEQNAKFRYLLDQCLTYIESQAGAEKMLDGFKPKKRPIDSLLAEVRAAIKS